MPVKLPARFDPDRECKQARRVLSRICDWGAVYRNAPELLLATMRPDGGPLLAEFFGGANRVNRGEAQAAVLFSLWQRTRGVYQFQPELRDALASSSPDGLTDAVFLTLPEWCVYIEVRELVAGRWLEGGFVAVVREHDQRGFYVLFGLGDETSAVDGLRVVMAVHGDEQHPVPWAMRKAAEEQEIRAGGGVRFDREYRREFLTGGGPDRAHAEYLMTLAAYLCTPQPDVRDPRDAKARPARKRHNGPVRCWSVGERFGAAYRAALVNHERELLAHHGDRARPRPHVRRAHWRTVLSGPMKGERLREVRWFPPVFVNANGDELPVVIWRH